MPLLVIPAQQETTAVHAAPIPSGRGRGRRLGRQVQFKDTVTVPSLEKFKVCCLDKALDALDYVYGSLLISL